MKRRLLAGAVAVLALAGCSSQGAASNETQPEATPPTPITTPQQHGDDEQRGHDVGLDPPADDYEAPYWDEESRARAERTATAAVEAFARPDLSYDEWWEGFSPHLSGQARRDFATVDPAHIPISRPAGEARIIDEPSPYLTRVQVPTDVGTVVVLLSRSDHHGRWMVEDIEQA